MRLSDSSVAMIPEARMTGRKKIALANASAAEFLIQQHRKEQTEDHDQRNIHDHIDDRFHKRPVKFGVNRQRIDIIVHADELHLQPTGIGLHFTEAESQRIDQRDQEEQDKADEPRQDIDEIPTWLSVAHTRCVF